MIEICNLSTNRMRHPWDVRIDRRSGLGNPYRLRTEWKRDKVCDQYETFFRNKLSEKWLQEALQELIEIYKEYGKLRLFCWCAPNRCHGDTIKNYLMKEININEGIEYDD